MTTPLIGPDSSAATATAAADNRLLPMDRLLQEQLERARRRRSARDEMQSDQRSAAEKIRAWERLHALQLPRDPNHIVLRVVSRCTGLRMEAVLEEQRLRAGRRADSATQAKSTT
jgi:hypothetical protein